MCSSCDNCIHSKFSKGACRGVMDCDPDEYWCSANEDVYYYSDDDEIEREMYYEFIEETMKKGYSQEEAEELAKEEEFEVVCPSYSPGDYYDEERYMDDQADYLYDRMREDGF